jgi:hypothetical protein
MRPPDPTPLSMLETVIIIASPSGADGNLGIRPGTGMANLRHIAHIPQQSAR